MPKKKGNQCYSIPSTTKKGKEVEISPGNTVLRVKNDNGSIIIVGNLRTGFSGTLRSYKAVISNERFGPSLNISSGKLDMWLEDLEIEDFEMLREICDQTIDVLQNEAKDFYD